MSNGEERERNEQPAQEVREETALPVDIIDQVAAETFDSLKKVVKLSAEDPLQDAVRTLIEQVARGQVTLSGTLADSIDRAIARIDEVMGRQIDPILHHPEFQKVESTWRGLHFLVHRSDLSTQLRIRVLDVSKNDLRDDLLKAPDFDQSGLFKLVYDAEYDTRGGEPFGALVADYAIGNNDPDLSLLEKLGQVAEAAHAPVITGVDPSLLDLESFTELLEPADIAKKVQGPEFARWRSLREKSWSKYVGLVLPRVLGRAPWAEKPELGAAFLYDEQVGAHEEYLWMNGAWAFGTRLTDAFAKFGWCTRITGKEGGGGVVEGLPVHTFPADDGTMSAKCPTEIALTGRRGYELEKLGFIPLYHYRNTDYAVFANAPSMNKPAEYDDAAATASAELSAYLPNTMAIARFAHYLKVIQRDALGTFKEREELERELSNWVHQYVLDNPQTATPELKARKPLAEAKVQVVEVPGKPGHYHATLWLRPHFVLQQLKVSLRLVASTEDVK